MKKFFYLGLTAFFFSCNSLQTKQTSGTTSNNEDDNEPVELVTRDTSINASNAYNNFFLDTAAVTDFINKQQVEEGEATRIRNFYNLRNNEFAWFNNAGITTELRNFWNIYTYTDTAAGKEKSDKKLFVMMDTLLPSTDTLGINEGDNIYREAEIAVTRKFLAYIKAQGLNPDDEQKTIARLLPAKKQDVNLLASAILDEKRDTGNLAKIERQYDALRSRLKMLLQAPIDADTVAYAGKLKKGMSLPVIKVIKRKLAQQGFIAGTDTSAVFSDMLEQAIKSYQATVGLTPDGSLSQAVVAKLNRNNRQMTERLIVNMNRLLWIPKNLPDHYIQVNIPEFMLHTYEGDTKVFDMPVVVGREGTSTMMFSGNMNNVVFSPYWNLPESIVKKEVLPGMDKDPGYIENHHMEITGKRNGLPVVRQLPGNDNALGRVKFLFPNSYDIYLHDTNAKYLFNMNVRAYSHGCIRLADAEKMADYVLRNDKDWSPEKIAEAMDSKEEKWVKLKEQEPVLITYLTAWVDENGKLNVRDDIYGHDEAAIGQLFIAR